MFPLWRVPVILKMYGHFSDENKCVVCNCPVILKTPINLQTELARGAFDRLKFSCYFNRLKNEVEFECKG